MDMREDQLTADEKKVLAQLLKQLKIVPIRQGRIIITITPDRTISSVEVTALYR
jgi:hypothetical protein